MLGYWIETVRWHQYNYLGKKQRLVILNVILENYAKYRKESYYTVSYSIKNTPRIILLTQDLSLLIKQEYSTVLIKQEYSAVLIKQEYSAVVIKQ